MSVDLIAEHITCVRNQRQLFADLTVSVSAGDCLQVIGPNGCGKTSLLRLLAGLLTPCHGEVRWQGQAIAQCANDYQRELVYVGHRSGVKPQLTVAENIRLTLGLRGAVRHCAMSDALAQLQLFRQQHCLAYQLSAGQQQRVALAQLLVADAKLWIVDEPMTAIDQAGREVITGLFTAQVQRGGLVVVASHQDITLPTITVKHCDLG